jgi:hypothetical protein
MSLPPKAGDGRNAPGAKVEKIMSQEEGSISDEHRPELDSKIRLRLGKQLSAFYGELVKDPVPDHFIKLLDELSRKEKNQ